MSVQIEYDTSEAIITFFCGAHGELLVEFIGENGGIAVIPKETAIAMANDILDHYGIKQNLEIE